jgi:AraC family transcriptional regulator
MSKPLTIEDYQQRILRVLVHIQTNLDGDLSLEKLAGIANFSPFHFHRIFRGLMGESVKEHVRRLRLERAALWLLSSDMSVTRIAFDSGYESHESFTRAFAVRFGDPPSEYRARQRALRYKDSPGEVHFVPEGRLERFRMAWNGSKSVEVRMERMGPLRVAFMRHVGPYHEVSGTWQKLMAWAGRKGLMRPGMTMLGMSYDDPEVTPPDKLRYDAAIVVDVGVQPEGEGGIQEIPAGDFAVITHHGSYERFGETYALLFGRWAPENRRELVGGPSLEFYRNSPCDTPPEKLRTDIYVRLENGR